MTPWQYASPTSSKRPSPRSGRGRNTYGVRAPKNSTTISPGLASQCPMPTYPVDWVRKGAFPCISINRCIMLRPTGGSKSRCPLSAARRSESSGFSESSASPQRRILLSKPQRELRNWTACANKSTSSGVALRCRAFQGKAMSPIMTRQLVSYGGSGSELLSPSRFSCDRLQKSHTFA